MKQFSAVRASIVTVISMIALVGCTDVNTSRADFTRGVSVQSGITIVPLASSDPMVIDIDRWIRISEPRWKRSLTTYVPKLIFRNPHFTLNLFDGLAVLNFKPDPSKSKWIQIEREYSPNDFPSLESLRAKIKQAEQGGGGNSAALRASP